MAILDVSTGESISQPPMARALRRYVPRAMARAQAAQNIRERIRAARVLKEHYPANDLGFPPAVIAIATQAAPAFFDSLFGAMSPSAPPPPPPPPCGWWDKFKRFFGVRVDYCV